MREFMLAGDIGTERYLLPLLISIHHSHFVSTSRLGEANNKQCTTISILSAAKEGHQNEEVEGVKVNTAWSDPTLTGLSLGQPNWEDIAVASEEDYEVFKGRWW